MVGVTVTSVSVIYHIPRDRKAWWNSLLQHCWLGDRKAIRTVKPILLAPTGSSQNRENENREPTSQDRFAWKMTSGCRLLPFTVLFNQRSLTCTLLHICRVFQKTFGNYWSMNYWSFLLPRNSVRSTIRITYNKATQLFLTLTLFWYIHNIIVLIFHLQVILKMQQTTTYPAVPWTDIMASLPHWSLYCSFSPTHLHRHVAFLCECSMTDDWPSPGTTKTRQDCCSPSENMETIDTHSSEELSLSWFVSQIPNHVNYQC